MNLTPAQEAKIDADRLALIEGWTMEQAEAEREAAFEAAMAADARRIKAARRVNLMRHLDAGHLP